MDHEHLSLGQAASRCPGRPSANTLWRWCRKGVIARSGRRVRLEHIRAGARLFTTRDALERFFEQVAEADTAYFDERHAPPTSSAGHTSKSPPRTGQPATKSATRAARLLDHEGI